MEGGTSNIKEGGEMKILVTGEAGFIGSHGDALAADEHSWFAVLDNLDPQVHGKKACMPIGLRRDGHS